MSENDIDHCSRCGRASYLWVSTGCDYCAATVKEFEIVGPPSVAQGWQGSLYAAGELMGEVVRVKALFALKAREMRCALRRWVTQEEVLEALRWRV